MMVRVELLVKDGIPIGDLIPELLKVSKGKLINDMLHLVSRVCVCDEKIAKLHNYLNIFMSSDECVVSRVHSVIVSSSYKSS